MTYGHGRIISWSAGELLIEKWTRGPFSIKHLHLLRRLADDPSPKLDEADEDRLGGLYGWDLLQSQPMTWNTSHYLSELGRDVLKQLKTVET